MRETDVFTVRTEAGREYTVTEYTDEIDASRYGRGMVDGSRRLETHQGYLVNDLTDGLYLIVPTGERGRRGAQTRAHLPGAGG
jgi:hypothetical protein